MINWITAALRARREQQRLAGKAWAQGLIEKSGVSGLNARMETDYAMGFVSRAFDEGALEALQEAKTQP
jgi:hypothetical protein